MCVVLCIILIDISEQSFQFSHTQTNVCFTKTFKTDTVYRHTIDKRDISLTYPHHFLAFMGSRKAFQCETFFIDIRRFGSVLSRAFVLSDGNKQVSFYLFF